jgi:hypothetical protein
MPRNVVAGSNTNVNYSSLLFITPYRVQSKWQFPDYSFTGSPVNSIALGAVGYGK